MNTGIRMDTITVVTLKGVLLGAKKDMGETRILRELCVNVEVSNTELEMMSIATFLMIGATRRRSISNANRLLELITQFPKINPSSTDAGSELDIPQLLSRIRSRYKVLCASFGVRPTLRAARSDQPTDSEEVAEDRRQELKPKIWPVLSQLDPSVTNQDLNY